MNISMGIPICPITQEPMKDPVIDREGNSYEKKAILEWLKSNNNCNKIIFSQVSKNYNVNTFEISVLNNLMLILLTWSI